MKNSIVYNMSRSLSEKLFGTIILGGTPLLCGILVCVFWIGYMLGGAEVILETSEAVYPIESVKPWPGAPEAPGEPETPPVINMSAAKAMPAAKSKKAASKPSKPVYRLLTEKTDNKRRNRVKAFVKRFYPTAQAEAKKYGQPASVKLAQGILESGIGKSTLSKYHNNYFGIKCFKVNCSRGHCVNYHDDDPDDRFKKYDTAWASWRDHSRKVSKGGRYKKCHGLSPKQWCSCLKLKGYATSPRYSQDLRSLMEEFYLTDFDH